MSADRLLNLLRPALIVTRREIRDQLRDWRILLPMILLTVIFPGLMNFTSRQVVAFAGQFSGPAVAERMIPFLLMIVGFFPISISLVIALESFVGEKERRSIEPLLNSPLTDFQLYLGKLLAALIPPLLASYLGMGIYLWGVLRGGGWSGPPGLLATIFLLNSVQALVMVSGAVVLSAQTTSTRAANLLASFIILPMALLIQGESAIIFWGQYEALGWVIVGELFIAGLLLRAGLSQFNREELLGRDLDFLNLRLGWRIFRGAFRGQGGPLLGWYGREVGGALRALLLPAACMGLALGLGVWAGASQAQAFALPPEMIQVDHLSQGFIEGLDAIHFFSAAGVGYVWVHNLRAILLATLLGIFSFGVLGVIVLMLPMALIGYFMASLAHLGMSPAVFLAGLILPHGTLEMPALILAGGAILRLGATLAAPAQKGQRMGEAWLGSLADWAKIMLGLVLPLLLAAAMVEVYVTPHVAVWLFGG